MTDYVLCSITARHLEHRRRLLDRVEIRRDAYGSHPWHAVDPVTGQMIGLPPHVDEVVEVHDQRLRALNLLWPSCFRLRRDVAEGLARYRTLLDKIEAAS